MNTPPLNLRIQRDREIFWSHALAKITNKSSLQRFVCSYLSFLGHEYDTAILQAIAQLQHLPHNNQLPLAASILSLAAQLQRQPTMAGRLPLWQQLAELVDYSTPITTLEISLHTRAEVISYYKTLLSRGYRELWPVHDIAYRLVNVMAHYDITEQDKPLYELWDLATELEIMSMDDIQKTGTWNKLIRSAGKL